MPFLPVAPQDTEAGDYTFASDDAPEVVFDDISDDVSDGIPDVLLM